LGAKGAVLAQVAGGWFLGYGGEARAALVV